MFLYVDAKSKLLQLELKEKPMITWNMDGYLARSTLRLFQRKKKKKNQDNDNGQPLATFCRIMQQ